MRRIDDYDPDEGGRYDGDDAGHGSRFNRPEWLAIVMEQEAAKRAVFEEAIARTNALYHTPQPGEIACRTCGGAGTLKDTYAYGPSSHVTCWRCDGRGFR